MSNTVTCAGAIAAEPSTVTDGSFPAGSTSIPFALNPPSKPFTVDTGRALVNVNSPSSFTAFAGVGAGAAVTQASFLYVRTQSPMQVRITQNGSTSVVKTSGLFVLEPEPGSEVTLVEFQGAGTVELYASGTQ